MDKRYHRHYQKIHIVVFYAFFKKKNELILLKKFHLILLILFKTDRFEVFVILSCFTLLEFIIILFVVLLCNSHLSNEEEASDCQ